METKRPIPESTKQFHRWLLDKMQGDLKPYGFGSLTGSQAIGGATEESGIDLLFVAKENSAQRAMATLREMGFRVGLKDEIYGGRMQKWGNPASGIVLGHRYLPVRVIMKFDIAHYNAHILATREMREMAKETPAFLEIMKSLKGTSHYYAHWDRLINEHFGRLTADQIINPIGRLTADQIINPIE